MTRALADRDEAFARNVEETAVGALVEPRDVAAAVAFLCSEAARYITGTVLDVNGGSFMP
jgi:3-oxoacyl-[acyl-carrier protein] reductase